MTTPQDSGADQPWLWAAFAALAAVFWAWIKKANPWPLMQRAAQSLNAPLYDRFDQMDRKIDRLCEAFDELPDGAKAKATAKAKREGWE